MQTLNKRFVFFVSLGILIFMLLGISGVSSFLIYQNYKDGEFDSFLNSRKSNSTTTSEQKFFKVTRIVDGDTIKIDRDGIEETIRLIGIDTPEIHDPRKSVQCFGQEASYETTRLLENKEVRVEEDNTQAERDTYGRLLYYVYRREDDLFINKYLIESGYAYEYTYNTPYKYQSEFKSAQNKAKLETKGIWGSCK